MDERPPWERPAGGSAHAPDEAGFSGRDAEGNTEPADLLAWAETTQEQIPRAAHAPPDDGGDHDDHHETSFAEDIRDLGRFISARLQRVYNFLVQRLELDENLNDKLPDRSLIIFSRRTWVRKLAIRVVCTEFFADCAMLVILGNCVTLAFETNAPTFYDSQAGKICANADKAFTALFCFEALMKILAMGFFAAEGTYLRDRWNRLDFLVVCLSLLDYVPSVQNYTALRIIKILRPLRTMNRLKGMRRIIETLLSSVSELKDVALLMGFVFIVFGIIGVQLFSGRLSFSCAVLANPRLECVGCDQPFAQDGDGGLSPAMPVYSNETLRAQYGNFTSCPANCTLPVAPLWRFQQDSALTQCTSPRARDYPRREVKGKHVYGRECPAGWWCVDSDESPNWDITSFDNILSAWLTIFQCITLTNWTDIMYQTQDAFSQLAFIYFVLLVLFTAYFGMNLAVAVLVTTFRARHDEGSQELTEDQLASLDETAEEESRAGPGVGGPAGLARSATVEVDHKALLARDSSIQRAQRTSAVGSKLLQAKAAEAPPADGGGDGRRGSGLANGSGGPTSEAGARPLAGVDEHATGSSRALDRGAAVAESFGSPTALRLPEDARPRGGGGRGRGRQPRAGPGPSSAAAAAAAARAVAEAAEGAAPLGGEPEGSSRAGGQPGRAQNQYALKKSGSALRTAKSASRKASGHIAWDDDRPATNGAEPAEGDAPEAAGAKDAAAGDDDKRDAAAARHLSGVSTEDSIALGPQTRALRILDPSARPPGKHASRLRKLCYRVAYSRTFEEFSVLIIVANTVLMASQYRGMDDRINNAFDQANYAFTVYFALEMILKNVAVRPRRYFSQSMNVADFLVVVVSLIEMSIGLARPDSESSSKLSFLRSFRLLRILKLVRTWEDIRLLIDVMAQSISSLGWLCLLIFLYMFTFAILGQQLFSYRLAFCDSTGVPNAAPLCPPGEACGDSRNCFAPCAAFQEGAWVTYSNAVFGGLPDGADTQGFPGFDGSRNALGGLCKAYRAAPGGAPTYLVDLGRAVTPLGHFDDVYNALITIFRILTFDNWANILWDCMRSLGPSYAIYFILTICVGNYLVLNLFIAILLDKFMSELEVKAEISAIEAADAASVGGKSGLFKTGLSVIKTGIAKTVETVDKHAVIVARMSSAISLEGLSRRRSVASAVAALTSSGLIQARASAAAGAGGTQRSTGSSVEIPRANGADASPGVANGSHRLGSRRGASLDGPRQQPGPVAEAFEGDGGGAAGGRAWAPAHDGLAPVADAPAEALPVRGDTLFSEGTSAPEEGPVNPEPSASAASSAAEDASPPREGPSGVVDGSSFMLRSLGESTPAPQPAAGGGGGAASATPGSDVSPYVDLRLSPPRGLGSPALSSLAAGRSEVSPVAVNFVSLAARASVTGPRRRSSGAADPRGRKFLTDMDDEPQEAPAETPQGGLPPLARRLRSLATFGRRDPAEGGAAGGTPRLDRATTFLSRPVQAAQAAVPNIARVLSGARPEEPPKVPMGPSWVLAGSPAPHDGILKRLSRPRRPKSHTGVGSQSAAGSLAFGSQATVDSGDDSDTMGGPPPAPKIYKSFLLAAAPGSTKSGRLHSNEVLNAAMLRAAPGDGEEDTEEGGLPPVSPRHESPVGRGGRSGRQGAGGAFGASTASAQSEPSESAQVFPAVSGPRLAPKPVSGPRLAPKPVSGARRAPQRTSKDGGGAAPPEAADPGAGEDPEHVAAMHDEARKVRQEDLKQEQERAKSALEEIIVLAEAQRGSAFNLLELAGVSDNVVARKLREIAARGNGGAAAAGGGSGVSGGGSLELPGPPLARHESSAWEGVHALMSRNAEGKSRATPARELKRPTTRSKSHRRAADDESSLFLLAPANPLRRLCERVIKHRLFDPAILTAVAFSSIALALDRPSLDPDSSLKRTLNRLDLAFVVIFAVEAGLKIIAYGFVLHKGAYLRGGWNVLDGVIVVTGIVSVTLTSGSPVGALRAARTLRALRPLRVVHKMEGMKKVIDALFAVIPSIANVMVIAFLIYFLFGILGLNLFMGKMWYCEDQNGNRMDPRHYQGLDITREWCEDNGGQHVLLCPREGAGALRFFRGGAAADGSLSWNCTEAAEARAVTNNATGLVETFGSLYECAPADLNSTGLNATAAVVSLCPPTLYSHHWRNSASHFDNIGFAVLALFEMASQESWTDVQYAQAAAVGEGLQPVRDANPAALLFGVAYMMIGSFILINLFVGVTLDKFWEEKEKHEGRFLLTEDQSHWRTITKMMLESQPKLMVLRPASGLPRVAYRVVQTRAFEVFITLCIAANTLSMLLQRKDADAEYTEELTNTYTAFTFIFAAEAALKLLALGVHPYFRDHWNKFDMFMVVSSLAGVIASRTSSADTNFLGVLRIMRVARVFRLIPAAQGLRTLFNTFILSLPALGNVMGVILLFYFIFAVVGMNLFGRIKMDADGSCLDRHTNFQDFPTAMLVLVRMTTGENWNCVMHSTFVNSACVLVSGTGDPALDGNYFDPDAPQLRGVDPARTLNECVPFGSTAVPIIYFGLFMVLCAYVLINIVVAIIIDNLQANKDAAATAVTDLHLRQFEEAWSEFDPRATEFIRARMLNALLRKLDQPLGVRGLESDQVEAQIIIQTCHIPHHHGGYVHFLEVLQQLSARVSYAELPDNGIAGKEKQKFLQALVKATPSARAVQDNKMEEVPRFTAGHILAATYVAAAVRGFLARHREDKRLEAGGSPGGGGGGRAVAAAIRRASRKIAIQALIREDEDEKEHGRGEADGAGAGEAKAERGGAEGAPPPPPKRRGSAADAPLAKTPSAKERANSLRMARRALHMSLNEVPPGGAAAHKQHGKRGNVAWREGPAHDPDADGAPGSGPGGARRNAASGHRSWLGAALHRVVLFVYGADDDRTVQDVGLPAELVWKGNIIATGLGATAKVTKSAAKGLISTTAGALGAVTVRLPGASLRSLCDPAAPPQGWMRGNRECFGHGVQ